MRFAGKSDILMNELIVQDEQLKNNDLTDKYLTSLLFVCSYDDQPRKVLRLEEVQILLQLPSDAFRQAKWLW